MATPIPPGLQGLVHAMLPTIPIDQLDYLRGFDGVHKGVDIQAKWDWKNCLGQTSNGKGEPVCSPRTRLKEVVFRTLSHSSTQENSRFS